MLSKIRKSLPENYAKYIKITTKIFQIHSKSSLEAFLGRLVTENWEWGSPRPARPRIWDPLEAPKYNRNQSNAAKTVPKLIKKENSKIMWFPRTFFNWFLKFFDLKIHRFLNLFSISFSIERQKMILWKLSSRLDGSMIFQVSSNRKKTKLNENQTKIDALF